MKAAIPMHYIVAIIFVTIVLVTVGYWYYQNFQKGAGSITESLCIAKWQKACSLGLASTLSEFLNNNTECREFQETLQKIQC